MARPLEGLTVLEFANFIAGPFCGMLLADMGADVIKIEPPKGDLARAIPPIVSGESAAFINLNRNKRSLVLDLKQPEARDIVYALARNADAIVENNRPGAMERLGLGADRIRQINPRIVYTSVSGFGQTGPHKNRGGVNLIIEAMSGTLSVNGEPGTMPMRPGLQTADILGAMFGTYATLSGLIGAVRKGEGRIADVALLDASIASAVWEIAGYLTTGEVPEQMGHSHRANAPYQLFQTRDDRYVAIGTSNDRHFASLMAVLGIGEHTSDPRFSTYSKRKENEAILVPIVAEAVRKQDAAAVEAGLMKEGVPCGPVNDFAQALDDPHARERGMVVDIEHPTHGAMKTVRNPVLFDHDGPAVVRAAPLLGQHSQEILTSLGFDEKAIEGLVQTGATICGSQSDGQVAVVG